MKKTSGMGAKNLGLRDLIFPQSRYFQQLARNVLISQLKSGLKMASRIKLNPGVENEHGL